ncbi:hypothetical protein EV421DRAFT_1424807 [Armillaria borealis]|uniref:Uncharacterized protein n=1 Tax=Armillaria borealis TaxID=47425 RepID=A0AA39IWC3_9AGAR|nr:hypothetical protein EV421DRAFT_244000 [Armillaria borealis]KAK0449517.1 hypothetical protein EV421DRAFT_1424807 [Armillaria borealis]
MSREHDIPIILPAAFYFVSTISPAQSIDLHLKRDDVAVILSGRDKIAEDAFKIAWSWLFISSSGSRCSSVIQCQRRRLDVVQKLARSPGDSHRLFLNTMPHQYLQEEDKENGSESEDEVDWICNKCPREWRCSERNGYQQVWNWLPSYFKLPNWINWGRIHSDWKTEDILSTNKYSYALDSGVDSVNLKKERIVSFRTFVHSLYYI